VVQLSDRLPAVIGEKSAKSFDKAFGIETVGELLLHAPRRYAQRGELSDLRSLNIGDDVTVLAEVADIKNRPMKNRKGSILDVTVTDGTASLHLTFFNQAWRAQSLQPGRMGMFSGKVTAFKHLRQLAHPEYVLLPADTDEVDPDAVATFAHQLIPVYPASAKMPSWRIARTITYVLDLLDAVPETIPDDVVQRQGLLTFNDALHKLHRPETPDDYRAAKRRLTWDEAFVLLGVMQKRRIEAGRRAAQARVPTGDLRARFDQRLPYTLTRGQQEVGAAIEHDLAQPHPMHRLLQGEVGSGKTIVALRAMLQVVDAGGQSALLAPTEVLAQQHYRTLRSMLGPLGARGELDGDERGTQVVLLTGSSTAAQRKAALLSMASGDAGIVVGTHALLQDKVQFFDLGLIVVDEQHRFGVEQRAALGEKARDGVVPHTLVMTATPIPRTAAITVFGDLEVSSLTELPAGRSPIASHVVPASEKPQYEIRMWQRVREEAAKGHQAYVVCPRISVSDADESETAPAAAEEVFERLRTEELHDLRVGLLHGRMSPDEKDDAMRRFSQHGADGYDVLVSTTVIEVGVDVPNASTMVVLDADRFGISQLHQLRGRVGRGSVPGLCLLHTRQPMDTSAGERLTAVAATTDGFLLADLDLEQRGEGDVLGVLQSGGRSTLRLLSVLRDQVIITNARDEILAIFDADPDLERHPQLRNALDERERLAATDYLDKS
jgi:ATP-dependent DNA helicase RecG